jgi:hypothetical protein
MNVSLSFNMFKWGGQVNINEIILLGTPTMLWPCYPIKFWQALHVNYFCLSKENKKGLFSTLLFNSFQNPVVHQISLTFGNHILDIKSKISSSLLFLF